MLSAESFHTRISKFNVDRRPEADFQRWLASLSQPRVIPNFLSADEIQWFFEHERHKPDEERTTKTNGKVICTKNWDQAEEQLLRPRLREFIGEFEVWGGNYFYTSTAFCPHVDNGEDLSTLPYKNILLPLAHDPGVARGSLVLFEQRYFGPSATFYGKGFGEPQFFNQSITDYSKILNWDPAHKIEPELLTGPLECFDPQDLRGFSIDQVIPWEVGSCIIFDSCQIHCSGSLKAEGLKSKFGYSLFTTQERA